MKRTCIAREKPITFAQGFHEVLQRGLADKVSNSTGSDPAKDVFCLGTLTPFAEQENFTFHVPLQAADQLDKVSRPPRSLRAPSCDLQPQHATVGQDL